MNGLRACLAEWAAGMWYQQCPEAAKWVIHEALGEVGWVLVEVKGRRAPQTSFRFLIPRPPFQHPHLMPTGTLYLFWCWRYLELPMTEAPHASWPTCYTAPFFNSPPCYAPE